jgi:uncharacterized protein YndB with AHSA1/START domain
MTTINHKLVIKASPEKVFEAITSQEGLQSWFAKQSTAKPEVGFTNTFTFGTFVNEMEIALLKPNKRVEWNCTRSIEEWVNTTISFDLEEHNDRTILRFAHADWKAVTDNFASTNYDWGRFLASLKSLCENGTGLPS